MAIVQTMTTSFKLESWQAIHDLPVDTLKLALYVSAATLGAGTTVYTTSDEVSGGGYTAGGVTLVNVQLGSSDGVAWCTFDNPAWTGVSFTARGGLIYNASKANRTIAVLDFGGDRVAGPNFTVQMPVAGPTTSLLRFN